MTTETRRLIALIIIGLIIMAMPGCSPRLHTGWISVAKLDRMGYKHPPTKARQIYLKRTTDTLKVNIVKN